MSTTTNTMRVVRAQSAGTLAGVELPIPEPGPGEVRVRVEACGICHSDMLTVQGAWPGVELPRVPGHEIAGVVDALGEGVTTTRRGARVGIGWHGGHDGTCEACRRGDFISCSSLRIPGIVYDGGWAPYVVAPANVLAAIPDELSFAEAAPLLCAGVTTYNSLRHSPARAGDVVAVLGVGGLGHLGVQFAAKMGFVTVAIARGREKEPLARQLGAVDYIDSETENVAERLLARGGARVVLATATSAPAMTQTLGGLALDGQLLVVGAPHEPLSVPAFALIGGRRSVKGWPSGIATDSEDTMRFAVQTGVRPMIETVPAERAQEAYERMLSGAARFRMVLTHGG